jgi:hypothetical protein
MLTGPDVLLADAANQFDETGKLTNERTSAVLAELMGVLKAEAGRSPPVT